MCSDHTRPQLMPFYFNKWYSQYNCNWKWL